MIFEDKSSPHKILVIRFKIQSFGLNKLQIAKFSKDLANFVRKICNLAFATERFNDLIIIFSDNSLPLRILSFKQKERKRLARSTAENVDFAFVCRLISIEISQLAKSANLKHFQAGLAQSKGEHRISYRVCKINAKDCNEDIWAAVVLNLTWLT